VGGGTRNPFKLMALLAGLAAGLCGGVAAAEPVQTAAVAVPAAAPRAAVLAVRIGEHPDKTRLVLEMSRATAFRVAPGDAPGRLLLDIPEVDWASGPAPSGRGLLRAVRLAGAERGVMRLELDTDGPARVVLAEFLPPRDGKPPRLVLDLERTDAAGFRAQKAVASGRLPGAVAAPAAASAAAPPPAPTLKAPAAAVAAPVPPAASARPAIVPAAVPAVPPPKPKAPRKPLIVLDPGHGGEDPGARSVHGTHEKELTLAAARELKRQLEATKRYRVALTREGDVFIPLRERTARARALGADLFISLHADSIDSGSVRGMSVYTLSDKGSDREAEMLAARENRADAIVGLDLSAESEEVVGILIDLAQRETRNQSTRFANLVVEEAGKQVALLAKPLRSAGFAVLTAPDVPSVLIEMGYLSHRDDAKLLATPAHRKRMAQGLVRAIDGYFARSLLLSRS